GCRAVEEARSLEDESLRHVAAAPKVIEHDQIADEITVGRVLEHGSDQFVAGCATGIPDSSSVGVLKSRTQMLVTCGSSTLDSLAGGGTTRTRKTWPNRSSSVSKSSRQPSSVTT